MVDELQLREFETMATYREANLAISGDNGISLCHACWVRDEQHTGVLAYPYIARTVGQACAQYRVAVSTFLDRKHGMARYQKVSRSENIMDTERNWVIREDPVRL